MFELEKLQKVLKWWFDKPQTERNTLKIEYDFFEGQDTVDFIKYVYVMEKHGI